MAFELIDTHCHLDDALFDPDRGEVVERARRAGVTLQIVPSTTAARWPRVKEVCARYPGLRPAYGMHPMFTDQHRDDHLRTLQRWLTTEPAVAVGECGLDYFISDPDKPRQRHLFDRQVELAVERGLPLIIHARRAVEEAIQMLRDHPGARGVFHSFSGSLQQALQLAEMGFMMSFGGPLTFDRATRLRNTVSQLPLEAIMLESDAPDQPDFDHRGERNEPGFVPRVLRSLSEIRGEPEDLLAARTTANARRLFDLE